MAFSMLLCCVVEAVEAEVVTATKREEKITEKLKEHAKEDCSEGKYESPDGKRLSSPMTKAQIEQASFKKFWDESAEWAKKLVGDIVAYASENEARDYETLMELLHRKKEAADKESIKMAFAMNIWPPLRSRGWKAEGLDGSTKEQYFYKDETVRLYLSHKFYDFTTFSN